MRSKQTPERAGAAKALATSATINTDTYTIDVPWEGRGGVDARNGEGLHGLESLSDDRSTLPSLRSTLPAREGDLGGTARPTGHRRDIFGEICAILPPETG
ncbi:hypothetical protein CKO51_09585 [Rhodopirellula sp. SM50]|nr:hypothetical protein CKO51_09585 [Rhodopirellula sp. SM50]